MIARHYVALSAAALLIAMTQPGAAQELKNKPLAVTTPDGLKVRVLGPAWYVRGQRFKRRRHLDVAELPHAGVQGVLVPDEEPAQRGAP